MTVIQAESAEVLRIDPSEGVYDAARAAALSGVPLSTLHYLARHGIYRPSIATGPRTRFWSWGDLLAVRAVAWFHASTGSGELRRTSMQQVRGMLGALEASGIERDELYRVVATIDDRQLTLRLSDAVAVASDDRCQHLLPDVLPLVQPFGTGPDLYRPRPLLRIIPGRLHGEPHLIGTRIASAVVYEFFRMGYPLADIQELYPDGDPVALQQAIEFEQSLQPAT